MLRITVIRNTKNAVSYFDKALVKGDYYTQEVTGQWKGKLATELGIDCEISREQYRSLINNRNPITDEKLTPRTIKNRRCGYDFTFNSPKSASLLYALTGDQAILNAHNEAVEYAMSFGVEKNMQTQEGQGKQKQYKSVGNCLYGSFLHFTTRPVENKQRERWEADPHIHTHAVVQNVCFNKEKQRYQAVEIGNIKREANYHEGLYLSKYSDLLKQAGYHIRANGRYFEIDGIDRNIIERYSRRSEQINELAKEKGVTDQKVKSKLGAWSRAKKEKGVAESELKQIWFDRLSPSERADLFSLKNRSVDGSGKVEEKDISKELDLALDHYLERKSAISEKLVLGRTLNKSYGHFTPEQIHQELESRTDILSLERGGTKIITTKEMVKLEEQNLSFAIEGRNTQKPLNPSYRINNSILNKDQRNAIQHVLTSRDRLILIGGDAGVGKTTVMTEVKKAIEEKSLKLFAVAPSADASRGTLAQKGFQNATTIADFIQNENIQEKCKNQVLLVDEAAMCGTKDMSSVLDIARKVNLRVILSGDYKQIQSVSAGDSMRAMEEKSGLPIARIKEIVRQKKNPDLKNAVKALADGKHQEAYRILDNKKMIKEIPDQEERDKTISRDFIETYLNGKTVMLVTPTHKEGVRLTNTIREDLKERGSIDHAERKYTTHKSLSWTESEKQDPQGYQRGMRIQFHKRTPGFRHGYKYEVQGKSENGDVLISSNNGRKVSPLPLQSHDCFQVYLKEETSVSKGDLIRINVNGKSLENKPIHNGQIFRIEGFDKHGNIQIEKSKTISKDYANFSMGYYRTAHASQGKDAQVLILSQPIQTFVAANERTFYVSVSRGAEEARIYTDNKEELKLVMSKPSDRVHALDIAKDIEQEQLRRKAHEALNEKINLSKQLKPIAYDSKYSPRSSQAEMAKEGHGISR